MSQQTEAAVLVAVQQPLQLMQLTIPALRPGQVLVDVAFAGVCHTQLLEVQGKRGNDRYLPHTLGHEGSGVVVDVGPDVTKVRPGDRVVLSWIRGHGMDVPSTVYQSQSGPVNAGAVATFVRRAVISENRVVAVPPDMPLREAALLGCAVPTGAGIVLNTAGVRAGQGVAIFGVGGIGLSAILAARMINADPIVAVDVLDRKLEWARDAGATHTVNAATTDAREFIHSLTGGKGLDYSIEAVGKRETMHAAFDAVRAGGGLCVIAGNLPFGETISINPYDLIQGKRLAGTWGGETLPDRDIPKFVEAVLGGQLNLAALKTRDYPLELINEAFADLERGLVGRALIRTQTAA